MENFGSVEYFELHNAGAFTCYLSAEYLENGDWKKGTHTGSMPFEVGKTRTDDVGKLGVPVGATCRIFVIVTWGDDHAAKKECFTYQPGCGTVASYTISGTTLDNSLQFNGTRQK